MKVEFSDSSNYVYLSQLEVGEPFLHNKKLYIKTDETLPTNRIKAVSVGTGYIQNLDRLIEVIRQPNAKVVGVEV